MASRQVSGGHEDLARFSRSVLAGTGMVDVLSPFDRRLRWNVGDRSGFTRATELRSGMVLNASMVQWEQPWAMGVEHAVSPIKFILARGPAPLLTLSDGGQRSLTGGMFSVGQIQRPVSMHFSFEEPANGACHEQVSLAVDRERLLDLLGVPALPRPIAEALSNASAYPSATVALVPKLCQLFDEIIHCDARRASCQVHLEGKGLELLAALIDELDRVARDPLPPLSQMDRDRLERARQQLVARIEEPPSLQELARSVGLNETKLKGGFRTLFGSPVYAYLREYRLEQARRLLRDGRYNVTEVAARTGYTNPSKFAAAFRKRFGFRPSDI